MRTTVTLDDDVQILLNKAMRERDVSFKQALNDGLREALSSRRPARPPYKQVTFAMGKALVDLDKATALAAELEDLELAARLREGR